MAAHWLGEKRYLERAFQNRGSAASRAIYESYDILLEDSRFTEGLSVHRARCENTNYETRVPAHSGR